LLLQPPILFDVTVKKLGFWLLPDVELNWFNSAPKKRERKKKKKEEREKRERERVREVERTGTTKNVQKVTGM
jgi:hypothetical protein